MAIIFIRRLLIEPSRFTLAHTTTDQPMPVLGAVEKRFRSRLLVVALLAFAVSVVTGPANSFIFVYAENVLHISDATTALMVVVASIFGLSGLLFGRWLADRIGRRPAGAGAMIAMALCAVLTYSGSRTALFVGYELAVFSASTFAPGAGALVNELFPTSVRASVSGWYVAAGVLGAVVGLIAFAEVGSRSDSFRASVITFVPVVVASALFVLLPETMGRDPRTCGRRRTRTNYGRPRGPDRHPSNHGRGAGLPRRARPRLGRLPDARHGPLRTQRRQPPSMEGHSGARQRHPPRDCATSISRVGTSTWQCPWRA